MTGFNFKIPGNFHKQIKIISKMLFLLSTLAMVSAYAGQATNLRIQAATAAPILPLAPAGQYTFVCPSGTYVSAFHGVIYILLDKFVVDCSDGSYSNQMGNQGGTPYTVTLPMSKINGFQSLVVYYGHYAGNAVYSFSNSLLMTNNVKNTNS